MRGAGQCGALTKERGAKYKPRGRGLGQRNIYFYLLDGGGGGDIPLIKNLQITTWFLAIYSDNLREKEVALRILLFFLFYTFLCSTSSRRYDKCVEGNTWLDSW